MLSRLALSLWTLALGAVVLYVFFTVLARIAPGEVGGLAIVVAGLAVLFTLRTMRIAGRLRDRGGDPALREEYNRARERRGF